MRSLIQTCSNSNLLNEDAAVGPNAEALKESFTATAGVLASTFGLKWDMDWSNKLVAALKAKQGEHNAEPANRGQAYDPIFYVFRCAEDIFKENEFLYVEGDLGAERGTNPLADFQSGLAESLHNMTLYNMRDLARFVSILGNVAPRWQKVMQRANNGGTLSQVMGEQMQKLVPLLMSILSIAARQR